MSRYVKSRSDAQLRGAEVDAAKADTCAPQQILNGDLNLPINPCGLIAWSYFNDTFEVSYYPDVVRRDSFITSELSTNNLYYYVIAVTQV
jgi:hypothetical protein